MKFYSKNDFLKKLNKKKRKKGLQFHNKNRKMSCLFQTKKKKKNKTKYTETHLRHISAYRLKKKKKK